MRPFMVSFPKSRHSTTQLSRIRQFRIARIVIVGLLLTGIGAWSKWGTSLDKPGIVRDNLLVTATNASFNSAEPAADIARFNLMRAEGLPGSENLGVEGCLKQLDEWARRVKSETERHQYRFRDRPAEFENSEGFFRMLMLAVVLAEDFKVQYVASRRDGLASANDGFFADSRNVFLHGLLGPDRRGTCSSLPVLYVAVGRRLGYPLKLVATRGHLFVRWEGSGERFNIEASGDGVNRFPDDYYRKWPFSISATEEATEGYLKSLTKDEEQAVLWSIRGMCLKEAGRWSEAVKAFVQAARLAPNCRSYSIMENECRRVAEPRGVERDSSSR